MNEEQVKELQEDWENNKKYFHNNSLAQIRNSESFDKMVKFIKQHWDVKAKPKNYQWHKEKIDEREVDVKHLDYDGLIDADSSSFPLNAKLHPHTTACWEESGTDPLDTLLSAVFEYGQSYGRNKAKQEMKEGLLHLIASKIEIKALRLSRDAESMSNEIHKMIEEIW